MPSRKLLNRKRLPSAIMVGVSAYTLIHWDPVEAEVAACRGLERFKQNGHGEAAESWINNGPNKELPAPQLKQAIGADVLAALEQQTGLSQEELLARLSRELPSAVDQ